MYELFLLLCACKHSQPSQIRWPGCDTLKNATGSAVKNHLGTTPPPHTPPLLLSCWFTVAWADAHISSDMGTSTHSDLLTNPRNISSYRLTFKMKRDPKSLSLCLSCSLPPDSLCMCACSAHPIQTIWRSPPAPRPPFTSWITIK